MRKLIIPLLAMAAAFQCRAQVSMPAIFSDNMVLQRNKPVMIWGKASAGEEVKVEFAGQAKTTKADDAGKWQVALKAMPASATATALIITGKNKIVFNDVLVGDVWLCSGQSNMDYRLDLKLAKHAPPAKGVDVSAEELAKQHPEPIRYVYVKHTTNVDDVSTTGWFNGNNKNLGYVASIGYFFAKEIYAKTHVPIGIISTSWGGTRIEEWTPPAAYEQSSLFKDQTAEPDFKIDCIVPGKKYTSMLAPIMPYTLKGALWYQGEANAKNPQKAHLYDEKFKIMVNWWRNGFKDKKLPFYYVQIAPYALSKTAANLKLITDASPDAINDEFQPVFWELQTKDLSLLSNTGMAVVSDLVDNVKDIHPSYKWIVAHRLALIAEAKTYGDKGLEYSGPMYKSSSVKDGKIYLTFNHAKNGLKANDGKSLNFFTIAGDDGKFVDANAVIAGNQVIVSSPAVQQPKYVRFGWKEYAMPNLFNTEGLPAVPFRTDDVKLY